MEHERLILQILEYHTELLIFIATQVGPDDTGLAEATAKLKAHTDALTAAINAAPVSPK